MSQTRSPPPTVEHDQDPRATFPNLEDYLAIKTACCADHKDAFQHLPTKSELKECAKYLSEWPDMRVADQWKLGEPKGRPQAAIETAIRYMSGCATFAVNPEAALNVLDSLHDPEYTKADYVGHLASQSDFARAHSCAAYAHYQKFKASNMERVFNTSLERTFSRRQTVEAGFGHPAHTSLKFALHHASESARLGLVSPIVLRVGLIARDVGEGLGVAFSQLVHRAKNYRPLWRAVGEHINELYVEARKALEANRKDPLEYACGAEGCATRAKSSASLKACSGKCPSDLKPRYCSKQCQVKDWPRHKTICKPGYGDKTPKIPSKSIAFEWFELEDPEPNSTPEAKSDLRAASISDDVQLQDDSPDRIVDDEKPQQTDRADTSEQVVQCAVQDRTIPMVKHAPCGAEDSPNARDNEGELLSQHRDHASVISSDLSITPMSCPDKDQARDNGLQHTADDAKARQGDGATQDSPRGEAVECAAEDDEEDITMLLLTEHVFYGRDDSQTWWSQHYLTMRTACFLDYHNARDTPSSELVLESQCAKDLAQLSSQQVSEHWKGSDSEIRPAATLEMALRYMSGTCTIKCRPNPEAALFVLTAFHNPGHNKAGDISGIASQPDLARAHGLAAHAHYQKFKASDEERIGWAADYWRRQPVEGEREGKDEPAHDSLRLALRHANESAGLGLVSSIVVRLGLIAREIGQGLGVDVGQRVLAERAKRYRPLWRAVYSFLDDLYAEVREALRGAAYRDSLEHVCGADGCGTRAKAGTVFKACSGTCPPDLKPRYCSKQCQVKDWSRHKKICKPGCVGKIPKIPDRSIVLGWFELEDPESEPETTHATVPEAKSGPDLPVPSPHIDVRHEEGIPARTADDRKPQQGDGAGNTLHAAAESAVHVHDKRTICGRQDVRDDGGAVTTQNADHANSTPLGLSTTASTSRFDHAQADCDSLQVDCTPADNDRLLQRNGIIQEAPEEAVECSVQDVGDDQNSKPEVEHPRSLHESEDSLSSPDSEYAPSTPPGLPGPPRPLFFGCIDPEYLRRMWEEEGPEALMDTGVWASNPPPVFRAPY